MLRLEEYIAKRKKEDGIDEFDISKRSENTKFVVNYVFEFFNQYIDTSESVTLTELKTGKVEKYRHTLRDHTPEVIDWLVDIYIEYGKWMDKIIINRIDDQFFFLRNTDQEFNELAYKIYYNIVSKYDFMSGTQQKISMFLKGHQKSKAVFPPWYDYVHINDEIDLWIKKTYDTYGINVFKCIYDYVDYYLDHPEIWPVKYKKRSKYYERFIDHTTINDHLLWRYEYKADDNICNINEFYRNIPKKPFIKGKKKYIKTMLIYLCSDCYKE